MKGLRINHLALCGVLIALVGCLAACGEDYGSKNPDDMVTLNLMDEDHGATRIGLTDIYMTRSQNICSPELYYICEAGEVMDLGHFQEQDIDLTTLTNQASLKLYVGYLAMMRDATMRFPSGNLAMAASTVYYRIWVDEWIKENKQVVGAKINFAQYLPQTADLPEWGKSYLVTTTTTTIEVPQSDIEAMALEQDGVAVTNTEHGKKSTTISVKLPATAGVYPLYLRYKNTFTKVYLSM